MAEVVKKEINLAEARELLMLIGALSIIYYRGGLLKICYNYILEEYSFCEDVPNTFELRVLNFAISKDRNLFAFVPNNG